MKFPVEFGDFSIVLLTEERAVAQMTPLCKALDQIPLSDPHTAETVLADHKEQSYFYAKWHHSLLALKADEFAGVIIGSERKAEPDNHRPYDSIYVHSFAVSAHFQHQGLGKELLATWIEYNWEQGMMVLGGTTRMTLQTNSADWNLPVQRLYESMGFKQIDLKPYHNRVDSVYLLDRETHYDQVSSRG